MTQGIRSLMPKLCPACGAVGRFARRDGRIICQECGHEIVTPAQAPAPKQTSEIKRIKPILKTATSETPAVSSQDLPPTSEIKRIKPILRTTAEASAVPVPLEEPPLPTNDTLEIKRLKPKPTTVTSEAPAVPPSQETGTHPPVANKPKEPVVPGALPYTPDRIERLKKITVSESIIHTESIGSWARAIYSTGLDHLRRHRWAEAAKSFKRVVEEERDFVDAHLWLARLSLTEKDQRDHLSVVLANMPNHVEAMTMMMVLNGQMTEGEAQRAVNPHLAPATQEADAPVNTQAKLMKCPNCGGEMKAGKDGQSVVCEACGHTEERTKEADYGFKSLSMALLKQRGQTVQWVVGERLLKCQTCGAERTLQHGAFSERCLFCGSSYVVQADALGSFQQPDGMVRFIVNREQATETVQKALSSGLERVKGWFVNNQAGRIDLETLFVPFWLFDFTLDVKRTLTRKSSYNQSILERARHMAIPPVRHESFSEMAHDVPVVASKEVDRKLMAQAGRFVVDRVKPYHPDLLASHSALIYSIPFDKAAMDARQIVSERMRTLYEESTTDEEVRVSLFFQNAMFRLVLMPFWVVTIVEQDGDLRPGMVNGQTGAVALGKSRRPQ